MQEEIAIALLERLLVKADLSQLIAMKAKKEFVATILRQLEDLAGRTKHRHFGCDRDHCGLAAEIDAARIIGLNLESLLGVVGRDRLQRMAPFKAGILMKS